jgi:succinyl-CoA synthetase alpha subunit
VQGITGRDGSFHAKGMLDYGTQVVGGVTPGKGGEQVHGIPVFNSVKEAVAATQANATVIYVPAKFAAGADREAADAGMPLIIAITEGCPTLDMLDLYHEVRARGITLIGPNCPACHLARRSARSASCPAPSTSRVASASSPAAAP